jgi:uncharacterized membrane protein YoaK (UPF0700 family)
MIRYDRRVRLLAAWLSTLAGFVDATGFLSLHGYFVSFMSGNTTQLGVGLAQDAHGAAIAGAMIVAFVLGVMGGTLAGRAGPFSRATRILTLVALLLVLAAILGQRGLGFAAAVTMTLAMGAENAVFEQEGEVHIGLTYMTGTLVKLAQHLTSALTGGSRFGWLSYLSLWLGLAAGALAGALVWPLLGLASLWLAAAAAAASAVVATQLDFRR